LKVKGVEPNLSEFWVF